MIPISLDQGLGVLAWNRSPAGFCRASIAATRTPEGTRQFAGWREPPVRTRNTLGESSRNWSPSASRAGSPPRQVALAWLLGRPGVTSLVVGARTDAQFHDNLAAAELKLTGKSAPVSTR